MNRDKRHPSANEDDIAFLFRNKLMPVRSDHVCFRLQTKAPTSNLTLLDCWLQELHQQMHAFLSVSLQGKSVWWPQLCNSLSCMAYPMWSLPNMTVLKIVSCH